MDDFPADPFAGQVGDGLAVGMHLYYEALLRAGFSEKEAFLLLRDYHSIFMCNFIPTVFGSEVPE